MSVFEAAPASRRLHGRALARGLSFWGLSIGAALLAGCGEAASETESAAAPAAAVAEPAVQPSEPEGFEREASAMEEASEPRMPDLVVSEETLEHIEVVRPRRSAALDRPGSAIESPRALDRPREAAEPAAERARESDVSGVPRRRAHRRVSVDYANEAPALDESEADVDFTMVRVYYATDRARYEPTLATFGRLTIVPLVALVLFLVVWRFLGRWLGSERGRWLVLVTRGALVLLVAFTMLSSLTRGLHIVWATGRLDFQYGPEQNLSLEFGSCDVSIPKSKQVGEIPIASLFEDPAEHMILTAVQSAERERFLAEVQACIDASSKRDAFVFVHGYNNSFEFAALRTAQIAYDLDFEGAPIFYSWPSQASESAYTVDEANSRKSEPRLAEFLLALHDQLDADTIHLIGHSMGGRLLSDALRRISAETQQDGPVFKEIILAAPDIDAERFRTEIAPAIRPLGQRVTVYASSRDSALAFSNTVHGGQRAGQSEPTVVVVDGIHTIDVSQVAGGHSYISKSGRVLRDILTLISEGLDPDARVGLRPETLGALTYWILVELPTPR